MRTETITLTAYFEFIRRDSTKHRAVSIHDDKVDKKGKRATAKFSTLLMGLTR